MSSPTPAFLSQPTVVRLPVLLRELLQGELLIPQFQRPGVWDLKQRINLLDSISRGYPVGSILVWRTRAHKLKSFTEIGGLIIEQREGSPEYKQYILDGHQRLSTLLSTLGRGLVAARQATEEAEVELPGDTNEWSDEIFYDLTERSFRPTRAGETPSETFLPTSTLFNPYAFDEFRETLVGHHGREGRRLTQIARDLVERFTDYLLPLTPLVTEDLEWVTESFRRINSAGTTMSETHMVHALSWSSEFNLNERIEQIQRNLTEAGWDGMTNEALLATLKTLIGMDPTKAAPDIVKARLKSDPSLLDRAERCLHGATAFLVNLGVRGFKILPYEHHLVALAFAASENQDSISEDIHSILTTWFWRTTYTAGLDNIVALRREIEILRRALASQEPFPAAESRRVSLLARINPRFARTRAFALRLAEAHPRRPNGKLLDAANYLALHGAETLTSLLPKKLSRSRENSPENKILLDPTDASAMRALCIDHTLPDQLTPQAASDVMRSHLIDHKAAALLRARHYDEFLDRRREAIDCMERHFLAKHGLELDRSNQPQGLETAIP